MAYLLIGLILCVVALIVLGVIVSKRGKSKKWLLMALLPLLICLLLSMVRTVPTGYTGVLTTFGRVEDNTLTAGVHIIAPWQEIVRMDNRVQKVSVQTECFSSDIQQVNVSVAINYCIDQKTAQALYRQVGINYYDNVVYPRVLENTKATFSTYTAEMLIEKRSELSASIETLLSQDMAAYGVTIVSVSIENVDFTDVFTNAVEAKQVAQQEKLTAKTKQEQLTMEAQQAADRQVIEANAAAEVAKIQADAELYAKQQEASANTALSASVTEALIQYLQAQQWDGKLPIYMGGESTVPILDLRDATAAAADTADTSADTAQP